ncbi:MAG TPA: winged helix-turn-helix domain-containing protein [Polyangiaceae bacterium]|nr:winged helix-turn-helix domain-containing protein [Polyangiaceae bacterium]
MQVIHDSRVASGWQLTSPVVRVGLSAEPPIGLRYLTEVRSMLERIGSSTMRLVEVDQRADLWLISGTVNWAEGFVRKSRAVGDAKPIVALDICPESGANVRILDAGADDCLACPFDPVELRARIQAIMRRQGSGLWRCPEIATNSDALRIRVREVEAQVSRKQFEIFSCLAQRRGHWVHTDEIIAIVSGTHHDRQTSLVRVQIHALRKALGAERDCIRSDGRKSYMLTRATD